MVAVVCSVAWCIAAAALLTLANGDTQLAELTAEASAPDDDFGSVVAFTGDLTMVGAKGNDAFGSNSGCAYVFACCAGIGNGGWELEAKLFAADAAEDDRFGGTVSISDDTAIIGADGDNDAGSDSGAAYIFVRNGSTWTQQQKLTAGDAGAGDKFGHEVSISGDTAVVGAFFHYSSITGAGSGAAYIFTRSGGTWSQAQKLTPVDAAANDLFGCSVGISVDTVIIGACNDNGNGSAYIFTRSGSLWIQEAKLAALNASTDDKFGSAVSVSGDIAVVGAYWHDNAAIVNSGSAFVFARSGTSWYLEAHLAAFDASEEDRFGIDVEVSGNVAVIGAYFDSDAGIYSGSAYVFRREDGGTWSLRAKLAAENAAAGDNFGYGVSIWDSGLGPYATAVGAPGVNLTYVFDGEIPTTGTSTTNTTTSTSTTYTSTTQTSTTQTSTTQSTTTGTTDTSTITTFTTITTSTTTGTTGTLTGTSTMSSITTSTDTSTTMTSTTATTETVTGVTMTTTTTSGTQGGSASADDTDAVSSRPTNVTETATATTTATITKSTFTSTTITEGASEDTITSCLEPEISNPAIAARLEALEVALGTELPIRWANAEDFAAEFDPSLEREATTLWERCRSDTLEDELDFGRRCSSPGLAATGFLVLAAVFALA